MRKLVVGALVTLDGVVEAPWTWVEPYFDEENKIYSYTQLFQYDAFLLGRVTYEKFVAAWAPIKGDEYFDKINSMPKFVASNTLKETTWNTKLIEGDVADEIYKLKNQSGKDIIKYGITNLDQTLLKHKLVDEFHLTLVPVVTGNGKHIFEGIDTQGFELELTNTATFRNGNINLTYVPKYK